MTDFFNLPSKAGQDTQNQYLSQIAQHLGVTAGNLQDAINMANQANQAAAEKITDLETRFQTLTAEQQQDAEVIDARDGETSLRARLDRDHAEFESHMADYASAHGGTYHKNILHNWDFRNPVNQRGQSSYSVGNYTIDRWRTNDANISVNINSGYITVSNNGAVEKHFLQPLEFMVPGDYTVSLLLANGDILSESLNVNDSVAGGSGGSSVKTLTDGLKVQIGDFSSWPALKLIIVPGYSFKIVAIKLELGSVSTLANDPPADYGEQLALCQRYALAIPSCDVRVSYISANVLVFSVPLSTTLRTSPSLERGTVTVKTLGGTSQTGFTYSYYINPNVITISATKTSHGVTDGFVALQDVIFSADL